MSFWAELKRRNVVRVGVAYAVVAWLLIEVASTLFPLLQLPVWTVTFVAALLLLGFPVALVLSWAYELTPDGLKKSRDVAQADSITPATGRKIDRVIMVVLAVAVLFLVVDNYVLDDSSEPLSMAVADDSTSPDSGIDETEAVVAGPSVAVLPFENLSSDPEQDYVADGISLELRDQLNSAQDLYVTPREHVLPFKGTTDSLPTIAARLRVEHLLTGSVRRSGETVRVSAALIRANDEARVWNASYDGPREEVLDFQRTIAAEVIEALTGAFDADAVDIFAGGTENEAAYDLYLRALAIPDPNRQIGLLREALTLDPDFALAQIRLATNSLGRARALGAGGNQEVLSEAERAVQRAVDLAPELLETQLLVAQKNLDIGQLLAAEQAYLAAIEQSGARDSRVLQSYGNFLVLVGRLRDAIPYLEQARRLAPYSGGPNTFLAMIYDGLGDEARSNELQQAADPLFTNMGGLRYGPAFWRHSYRGDLDEALRYGALGFGNAFSESFVTDADTTLALMRETYESAESQLAGAQQLVALFAALHGDIDLAVNAWRKTLQSSNAYMIFHWTQLMAPVRVHPRFKEALVEAGFVRYWRQAEWPDQCSPLGDDDFVCE